MTYNGVSMTQLTTENSPTVDDGIGAHIERWYLVNPSSGTHNVVATMVGSGAGSLAAASFTNVNQTTPLGTAATNGGTTTGTQLTNLSVATTSTGQLVIDAIASDVASAGVGIVSPAAGQTQLWNYPNSSSVYGSGGSTEPANGSTVTMQWNDANSDWADIGVAINPVSNSTADSLTNRLVISNTGNIGIGTSSPTAMLDVAGTTLLQNTTNSTNAFQIQNSIGSSLLNVDTTNAIATFGSSVLVQPNTDSTTAFQIKNHTGSNTLLSVDSTNSIVTLGTTNGSATTDVYSGSGGVTVQGGTGGISILTGSGTTSTAGISLTTGNASAGASGNIIIDAGTNVPSGTAATNTPKTFESGLNNMADCFGYSDTLASSTAEAHSGTHSLKITAGASGGWCVGDNSPLVITPVTAGHSYTFGAWVRAASTTGSYTMNATFSTNGFYGAGAIGPQFTPWGTGTDTNTGWTYITGTLVAPTGSNYIGLTIDGTSAASGEVHYIDDVSVVDTTSTATPAINIGAANAQQITIGNDNQTAATNLEGGAGGVNIDAGSGANINIGTSAVNNITLGSASGDGAITLQGGSNGIAINTDPDHDSGPITIESGNSSVGASGSITIDAGTNVASGTQLVDDDFESGIDNMTGWFGVTSTAQTTAQAHGGTHSLAITENGNPSWAVFGNSPGDTTVTPGHQYAFTAWVRAHTVAESIEGDVIWNGSSAGVVQWVAPVTDNTSGWTELDGILVAPALAPGQSTEYAELVFSSGAGINGQVQYLDDATITDLGNVTSPSVNIGAANAQTVTVGNESEGGYTNLYGGVNGLNLQAAYGGNIALGTVNQNNIQIGATGATANSDIIDIGDSTAAAQTVTLGSTDDVSATTIQGGTGNVDINTGAGSSTTGAITVESGNSSGGNSGNITIDNGTNVPGGTQIEDDTFETGTDNYGPYIGLTSVTQSSAQAHTGSDSLKLVESGSGDWATEVGGGGQSVTPGHVYAFTAWVKAGTVGETILGQTYWVNGAIPQSQWGSVNDVTTGWTEITGSVTAPPFNPGSSSEGLDMEFSGPNGNTGQIQYIDDVTVTDESSITAPSVNIGTANAQTVNIGSLNQYGITSVTGGGGVNVAAGANGDVNIGNSNNNYVTVGDAADYSSTTLQGGTGGVSINTGAQAGATGAIAVESGNSSGGDSGNVNIDTGTNSPGGTQAQDDTFEGSGSGSLDGYNSNDDGLSAIAASNTTAHSGSYSLKVTESAAYWFANTSEDTTVTSGHLYTFSVWVKAASTGESIYGNVYWGCSVGGVNYWGTATSTASGWTQITGSVTAPALLTGCNPGDEFAQLTVGGIAGTNGQIEYIDDATITDESSITEPSVNIGTSNAQAVNIGGNNTGQYGLTTVKGGGGISLLAGSGAPISVGTGNDNNVTVGDAFDDDSTTLQGGSNGVSINTGDNYDSSGSISITTGNSTSDMAGNISIDTGTSVLSGTQVEDDDFESGTDTFGCWFGCVSATQSAAEAHGGSDSLAVVEDSSGAWGTIEGYPGITATAGHDYAFTAWVRGTVAESITMDAAFPNSSSGIEPVDTVTDSTGGWTELTGDVTAPAGATNVYLAFAGGTYGGGATDYIDDATITDLGTVLTPNIAIGATNAQQVTLGNENEGGYTSIYGGGDGISLQTVNGGLVAIGTANESNINIGAVGSSTNGDFVQIADTTAAGQTIDIGGNDTSGGSSSDTIVNVQAGTTALSLNNATFGATLQTFTNTTTALQVQNADGGDDLNVDTTNGQVTAGNTNKPQSMQEWDNYGVNLATLSDSPHAIGNLVLLSVGIRSGSATVSGVSGGGVSSWSNATSYTDATDGPRTEIWEGTVTSTGSNTITITYSSAPGDYTELTAQEFSAGIGATWNVAASGHALNSPSSTVTFPSLTASASSQMYWGYMWTHSAANSGSTAGFRYVLTAGGDVVAYDSNLTSGSNYTPTATQAGGTFSTGTGVIVTVSNGTALTVNGAETISNTNSTAALQVQNAAGYSVLTADTSSNSGQGQVILGNSAQNNGTLLFDNSAGSSQVGLAVTSSNTNAYTLDLPIAAPSPNECLVAGSSTATQLTFGSCASGSAGINNQTSTQSNANFNIQSASSTSVGGVIQGATSQTADLLELKDSTGGNLLRVDASGDQEQLGFSDVSGIGGIGQYANLLLDSEQLDQGGVATPPWSTSSASLVVTPNNTAAPDGNITAEKLAGTGSVNMSQSESISAAAATYTFSVWLKQSSGSSTTGLCIYSTAGTPSTCTATAVTVNSTDWQRFSVTQVITGSPTAITAEILPGNGSTATIYAWGAQLVVGSTPEVYVRTTSSTVAASSGVVSNGGLFVSSKNASDVPLVVQGAPSQSGNLLQFENASGTNLATVSASGSATFANSSNSTTAFQIQNTIGASILQVGTSATADGITNYITDADFGLGSGACPLTDWAKVGSPTTCAQNATAADTYEGATSLQLVMTTTAGQGISTGSFTSAPTTAASGAGEYYTVTFEAMQSSGATLLTGANLEAVATGGGSPTSTCTINGSGSNTLSATGFEPVVCTLTFTGSGTISALAIEDVGTISTANTVYIDAVQLQQAATSGGTVSAFLDGSLALRGVVTSPVALQNASNSTTAFQVQSAAGATFFSVDTSDDRVYVGPQSGDTTGTVLALGNKTNSGDPTGVAGGMYYNSNTGTFRCYQNSAWVNCIATGLGSYQVLTSTSANSTYTTPANTKAIMVEMWGSGSAGGGGGGTAGDGAAGAGGGAGGYARKVIVGPASTYKYTIAAGGTAGTAGNNAGNAPGSANCFGTNSTACSSPIISCAASSGGAGMAAGTTNAGSTGGAGGACTGGDLNTTGAAGRNGSRWSQTVALSGGGGGTLFGDGGSGIGLQGTGITSGSTVYGSGGGGGVVINSATATAGGAGAQGVIIVWEFK